MTITNNWTGWIDELSKTRKVIAVELQGHGRTADIERDISSANLADDVPALLDHLKLVLDSSFLNFDVSPFAMDRRSP